MEKVDSIKNTKQSTLEVNEDVVKLNNDLKCDMCQYSCKKKNSFNKHMNTKHGTIEQNGEIKENTSRNCIVIKENSKNKENTVKTNCKKCDKMLTQEDNEREGMCQFCRMMSEYS